MADDPTEPADRTDAEALDPGADAADVEGGADAGPAAEATEATDQAVGTDEVDAAAAPVEGAKPAAKPTTGDAAGTAPKVVRKKVTSKRVTPKGAPQGVKAKSSSAGTKAVPAADHDDDDPGFSKRYTPPKATYAPGPSPWWVPALMFGLLIIGALVIMLNYMGAFGDAENIRLVIGLAFILGGIITATQYR